MGVYMEGQEETDLSQKTVVVLVILTVLISLFGTLAVLSESNSVKTEIGVETKGPTTGKVRLNVINPNDPVPVSDNNQIGLATGKVALNVLK